MRFPAIFALLLTPLFALCAADNGAICTPDGVCYLPGQFPSAASAVTAGDFVLLRKAVGLMDAGEFLAFLQAHSPVPGEVSYGFWGLAAVALIGGFLLNLTPCVLPLIPVNLAIIGAGGGTNGFRRGMFYGAGMAAAYGVVGVLAAFAGVTFGGLNSSPVFNIAAGVVFLIMALAMTGVINFDFRRLAPGVSASVRGGTAPFFCGALAALLAGACVAPAVVSVLVITADMTAAGNSYAVLLPFILGIGMALPWPFAGAGIAMLPKPGKFMNGVKYFFAVVIFLTAVYYIITGIRLAVPAAQPPQTGLNALSAARQLSEEKNLPILVKFTASWCKNCSAMEKDALADPQVRKVISEKFIPVTVSAENPQDPEISALFKAWQIPGLPAFVILDPANPQK